MCTWPIKAAGILCIALSACDKVELPIKSFVNNNPCPECPEIDSAALNKETTKVLVEEFTGHWCTFCPRHTRKLLELQEQNGDQVIVASIHNGGFATPEPDYPEDFTTPYGDALEVDYQLEKFGYPNALVLRAKYPEFDDLTVFENHTGGWENPIKARLNKPARVALGVAADYNGSQFLVRVSVNAIKDMEGDYKLVVLCIEDSIIAPQKDQDSDLPEKRVPDYTHRHMVRAQVNAESGIYGEPFISGGLVKDTWLDRTYSFARPANIIDPTNCSIIAFITDAATKEIIQAEECHVQPAD